MISSDPLISPTTRNDSGRSLRSCTKTGWRRRFPPKNIRFPIFFSSRWRAKSVWVKDAEGLTRSMNPNQLQWVREPVSSHSKVEARGSRVEGFFHAVACVGRLKLKTSERSSSPARKYSQFCSLAWMNAGSFSSCFRPIAACGSSGLRL